MNELLLYIRLEDSVIIDNGVARTVGASDKRSLVRLLQDAVAQQLVERWASDGEPIDLDGPFEVLDNRALGVRLTETGRARVNQLLDRAHEAAQDDELDQATRRALDLPRVDYATVMDDLAKS